MGKKISFLFLVLVMSISICACGNKSEKHPLVGEWYTHTIVIDDVMATREEMKSVGANFYIDLSIDKDMTYIASLGDGESTITGEVKANEDGTTFFFEEADLGGMINSDKPEELVITSYSEPNKFILVLTQEKPVK